MVPRGNVITLLIPVRIFFNENVSRSPQLNLKARSGLKSPQRTPSCFQEWIDKSLSHRLSLKCILPWDARSVMYMVFHIKYHQGTIQILLGIFHLTNTSIYHFPNYLLNQHVIRHNLPGCLCSTEHQFLSISNHLKNVLSLFSTKVDDLTFSPHYIAPVTSSLIYSTSIYF